MVREIEILEFLDGSGRSPFARWFNGLNPVAAARVTVSLTRLGLGNFSNVVSVGAGDRIVILLGGSTKTRQSAAIAAAQAAWAAYKRGEGGKELRKWH
jgi:putative component of toxin-antitoxin plasmid stabilization module